MADRNTRNPGQDDGSVNEPVVQPNEGQDNK